MPSNGTTAVEGSGASESTAKESTDHSVSAVILTVLSQAPDDGYLMISNESSIKPLKTSGAVHGDFDLLIGSYSKKIQVKDFGAGANSYGRNKVSSVCQAPEKEEAVLGFSGQMLVMMFFHTYPLTSVQRET